MEPVADNIQVFETDAGELIEDFENRLTQKLFGYFLVVIRLERDQHLESPPFAGVALPCTVKTKSRWAKASKAASGTMHSPDFSSLPENLPSKKPTAFFAVSRSGKVIATMSIHLSLSQIGTSGIVAGALEKRKK
jgi:hypothetical protein